MTNQHTLQFRASDMLHACIVKCMAHTHRQSKLHDKWSICGECHNISSVSCQACSVTGLVSTQSVCTLCCLQVYSVQDSSLCLTGTAEIPLGAIYMDHILNEDQLPIKMAGFGHCFRTEAGAGGKVIICCHCHSNGRTKVAVSRCVLKATMRIAQHASCPQLKPLQDFDTLYMAAIFEHVWRIAKGCSVCCPERST